MAAIAVDDLDQFSNTMERIMTLKRAENGPTLKKPHNWPTIKHSGDNELSLPEAFITEPHEFLEYFYQHMDRGDDDLARDGYRIIDNIGYIRLPRYLRGRAKVIQIFDWPRPHYFDIVSHDWLARHLPHLRGDLQISESIDLLTPYLKGVSSVELKRAVNCVVDVLEGGGPRWSAVACQRFFNNASNFLPNKARKGKDLDWRSK
jgi:hypothetical protein